MSIPPPTNATVRSKSRPPGRVVTGISVLTCFGIFLSVNIAGYLFFPLIGLILLAALIVAAWGIGLTVSVISNRQFPRHRGWLIVPAIFGTAFLLTVATADKDLVLRIARPWIERDVRSIMSDQTPPSQGWLGPLPVKAIVRSGDTLFFQVAGAGFIDSAGYAWSQSVPPIDDLHPFMHELNDNWWKWESDSFLVGF